jgi:hypothetical protein
MVDAPPLHRRKSFRNPALTKALELISHTPPPPVLHIRRAPLPKVGLVVGNTNEWELNDNIRMLVDLPTVDHFEMARWNMLSLASEAVTIFLNHKHTTKPWKPTLQPPDILGVHIYNAINGNQTSLKKVMDEITKTPSRVSLDPLITLIFPMYLKNDVEKAKELICYAVKKWPNSRIAQYLNRRLQRNTNMLLSDDIPSIYPSIIASYETNLAKSQKILNNTKPLPIKLLYLSFDVLSATLAAGLARWKLKYPRVAELINR